MKQVIPFLKELAAHNDREWFAAEKKQFETAKAQFETLVGDVITAMSAWDSSVKDIQAKDCVYRIYRDVRFSKDKSPYKTMMSALIGKGGRKSPGAICYLHIEPGKSFVAAGSYMPEPPMLKAIRQEIDYNFDEFKKILTGKEFEANFGELETEWKGKLLPKGYTADNPAAEFLKYKCFVVSKPYTDKQVEAPGFATEVAGMLKIAKPFNDFINRAVEQTEKA